MSEIRVTDIKGEDGSAAVNFSKGINVSSGVITATTFSGSGANLTSLPSAQLTGALPAISGANLTGLAAGGKINNVVTMVYEPGSSNVTTSNTVFTDTAMSLQITPSNTNSKILVYGIANGHRVNNSDCNGVINIKRAISGGSTNNLSAATYGVAHTYETNVTTTPIFWVDTQTGTAQRTYTVVFKVDAGGRETQIFRRNTSNFFMLAEILP
jgi:hypothetical protein|tara:strand:- start:58 stop:693 length:636 start_codon:yes stop_codon:yes gene_type:complete